MFLLILDVNTQKGDYNYFTFHNVSINTYSQDYRNERTVNFTFHNVSINTELQYGAINIK